MSKRERPVVLVAAQDAVIRRLVVGALRSNGFAPAEEERVPDPDTVAELHPDAVVVDGALGATAAGREVREQAGTESIPVLWLGHEPGPTGAVEALDRAGAADYVAAPFDPVELAARVRALVRRHGTAIASGTRRVGWAIVDLDRRETRLLGVPRPLRRVDWAILVRLLEDEGLPVPYEELLTEAFGSSYRDEIDRLRAAVARLRRALGVVPGESGPIRAIRGVGYRLDA